MGKKYKLQTSTFEIHYGGMIGLCVMPSDDEYWIWIDDRLKGRVKLNTLIHETIHASRPDLSEQEVEVLANDIEAVLSGEGWRERLK